MTTTATAKPQRLVFGEALVELGARNERIVVLDADVSSSTQTRLFQAAYPERFFNFGIAEANMVSAAAGLAASGMIPVVSTFALFIALRAGDQVRAQVAYTRLNVKLVGGYAGLSDYADGASHQSVEDIAVMRAIPNMTVISPSDIVTTRKALAAAIDHDGPVFLRISRDNVTQDYPDDQPFAIGRSIRVREGRDVTLIAAGPAVKLARDAARVLATHSIDAAVLDMHAIKPLDEAAVIDAARRTGAIVTIEEHNVLGGVGSAVCETVCRHAPCPVHRVGLPDTFGESGAYADILARAGLTVEGIVAAAKAAVAMKG